LIEHEGETLAGSSQVRLSALGEDVAGHLRGAAAQSEGRSDSRAVTTNPEPSNKPLQPASGVGGRE
jgi:hypothetical protein